jgi:hypothetical protein
MLFNQIIECNKKITKINNITGVNKDADIMQPKHY